MSVGPTGKSPPLISVSLPTNNVKSRFETWWPTVHVSTLFLAVTDHPAARQPITGSCTTPTHPVPHPLHQRHPTPICKRHPCTLPLPFPISPTTPNTHLLPVVLHLRNFPTPLILQQPHTCRPYTPMYCTHTLFHSPFPSFSPTVPTASPTVLFAFLPKHPPARLNASACPATYPSTPLSHPFHQQHPPPVVSCPTNTSNPLILLTAPTAPFAFLPKHPSARLNTSHPCALPHTLPLPFRVLSTNSTQRPSFRAQQTPQTHSFRKPQVQRQPQWMTATMVRQVKCIHW
ncbi:uncharacterized protein LACBIDRAFT_253637 [Laccaria bicolor S238N-H82]|uniref:Predicted protein n=1 Tax=Laccaria bicolor (strain S238N-H82 / ATCC MYA-4686) TaxID=486041 RepID=B0DR36_LACBS|nr:uncharacterized protein LACBIDRAFT_253637 [Laccaria bicolor S238N-H82]EDR02928.1 predicted protein [Laccaria bicolor S238N-H82]|eukprot:XP_001886351.1 predicted protein [Laccaria bicolor S238N-H82]